MREEDIKKGFLNMYKGFRYFTSTEEWALCLAFIEHGDLLKSVKFANDYLDIPPVKSFIRYHRAYFASKNEKIDDHIKRGLGAFWGYVFKSLLSDSAQPYKAQNIWVGDKAFGLKTASVFIQHQHHDT